MAYTDQSLRQSYLNTIKDSVDNSTSVASFSIPKNFNLEDVRLETYDTWTVPFINKNILAKTGLYFLKEEDRVKCHFCKIIIKQWENGDHPVEEHIKWSPSCPLLRRLNTENIPINVEQLNAILPPRSNDVCGHNPSDNDNEQIKYPEYRYEINRIHSFKEWPQALSPKRDDFIDTGLFYTGNGDKVICFSCGLGLKDWETGDNPLTEHARWTEGCRYLDHVKGERFVDSVKQSFEEPKIVQAENEEQKEESDRNRCVICLGNEKQLFVFIPCGHMVACGPCSYGMDKCPMCRATIDTKLKVYTA